jgi:hypothetical protein
MKGPVEVPPAGAADASSIATMIAGLRRRLRNPSVLEHPIVLSELRKLELQLNRQMSDGDSSHGRHRSAAAPQVEDVAGYDLKPDPLTATTAAEFMAMLRQYKSWSGDPSWRRMADRAGQVIVHSTMHAAMRADTLPKLEVVKAIITGCGGSQEDMRSFVTACRRLASSHGHDTTGFLPAPVPPVLALVHN